MNELLYNFMNQIEDANKIKEMTVEEFIKLVKCNELISEDDAKILIESFKKISSIKKQEDGDATDSDQRKKKYREIHKEQVSESKEKNDMELGEKQIEDDSIER